MKGLIKPFICRLEDLCFAANNSLISTQRVVAGMYIHCSSSKEILSSENNFDFITFYYLLLLFYFFKF